MPAYPAAAVGYDAWISAIRREQTADRARADVVQWDAKFNLVKINPLLLWTKKDVWNFILKNDIPYNPLHDQGYPSIGCWPCTGPGYAPTTCRRRRQTSRTRSSP